MKRFPTRYSRPHADGHQRHSVERTDPLRTELTAADDRVDVGDWSHLVPPVSARIPEVRIGQRWVSVLWFLPIGAAALIVGIAVAQHLRGIPTVEHFIETYPGVGAFQPPVDSGFPGWLRVLHFLNLLFMAFIIRSGLQILAEHPRLQVDAGSTPGREWLRLRGPVPVDRMVQSPP